MLSDDGRYVLLYNGEIYNFQSLREEPSLSALGPWRCLAAIRRSCCVP